MPQFAVNTHRFDPYKNFKFRVKWDGRYVAGISKVSALTRTTEVVEHRSGGDPSTVMRAPGQTKFEAVTLERGVTHDLEFERWANKVWNRSAGPGSESSLRDFRKNITIDLFNEAGQLVLSYHLINCWVSEYQALPELDANANAVAIQSMCRSTATGQNGKRRTDHRQADPEDESEQVRAVKLVWLGQETGHAADGAHGPRGEENPARRRREPETEAVENVVIRVGGAARRVEVQAQPAPVRSRS